jgi:hypothetical protein
MPEVMDPRMLDLICEGIAAGLCPIADDDDLRTLLGELERLHVKGHHEHAEADTRAADEPAPDAADRPRHRRSRLSRAPRTTRSHTAA